MTDGNSGKPLDPTDDAQGLMGDTSGLSGITSDNDDSQTNRVSETNEVDPSNMSDQAILSSEDKASEEEIITELDESIPPGIQLDVDGGDDTLTHTSPSVSGEESVSGDMPDPGSDDDTLANAQAMGMQLGEDEEHPQELDIARDIDLAEEEIRQK